jgi:hypothetical protein
LPRCGRERAKASGARQPLSVSGCELPACSGRHDVGALPGNAVAALAALPERQVDEAAPLHAAHDASEVVLSHEPLAESGHQALLRRSIPRQEQHAARALVEPVHQVGLAAHELRQLIPETRRAAAIRQQRDAAGLVEREQMTVVEDDLGPWRERAARVLFGVNCHRALR